MLQICTMTRHIPKLASAPRTGKTTLRQTTLLQPIQPSRQLTTVVIERIGAEIVSGRLVPGDRLPTEQDMMTAFGVSRTVVREAVAALRADGLVVTRQGAGAFVAADASQRPFRLDIVAAKSLPQVLEIIELRRAVEVEAASLAAGRGTPADHRSIQQALSRFMKAIERRQAAIVEDVALHRAIANATGNGQFSRFLDFLGAFIIPRRSLHIDGMSESDHATYLARLGEEHTTICRAICERRPDAAGQAMRDHLTRSRERYRRLSSMPE